jgi:hypothetical protein
MLNGLTCRLPTQRNFDGLAFRYANWFGESQPGFGAVTFERGVDGAVGGADGGGRWRDGFRTV